MNVVKHPNADDLEDEVTYKSKDGSSVTIKAGEGKPLTVKDAIYLLDDAKFRIHKMMYEA